MARLQMIMEPSLDEMLEDPIVQILMRRDGVTESEVRHLINTVAQDASFAQKCSRLKELIEPTLSTLASIENLPILF